METLFKNKTKTTMKTEKLTVKDWQLYPNAKGSMSFKANDFMINNIEEFIIFREKNSGTILRSLDISKWKLILRPIESLTEEEIATIGTALGITHKMVMNYVTGLMNYNLDFIKATYVSDKCKEWNIDIYGFIKSGKAVAE